MSHTLIRFLTSLLLINLVFSNNQFEEWLGSNKNKIFLSTTGFSRIVFDMDLKFRDENIGTEDSCYILLDVPNHRYQLKILNNIIYYDSSRVDQYNLLSNQLYRYKNDNVISSLISKIISEDYFFNFSEYKYDIQSDTYLFNIDKDLRFSMKGDKVNVHYNNNFYDCKIENLRIQELSESSYNSLLLYSKIDTNKIDIFK